jgi:predicted  nucleic acid-binding Zn-ribbon protein
MEQVKEEQSWSESEIKELLEYVQYLRQENEDLQAKMIAMDAYVKNADAKVKKLTSIINLLGYGTKTN